MIVDKKKFLIILTVIVAVLYAVVHLLSSNKKPTPTANPVQPAPAPMPAAAPSQPATTPSATSNWGKSAAVNDQTSVSEAYRSLIDEQEDELFNYFRLSDEQGKDIRLDNLAQGLNVGLPDFLKKRINNDDYYLFSCQELGKTRQYGIILFYSADDSGETATTPYQDMIQWEPTMLKDLYPLLFPTLAFSSEQLQQSLIFSQGQYREASVQLPDSTSGAIAYSVIDGPIVITTSLACVDIAKGYFFDVDEN